MKERGNSLLKIVDRYIGIPLVFLLGKLSKRREKSIEANTSSPGITLLKTAAIGDTILISAIINEIRRQYPTANITFVCSANNRKAVELLTGVDEIFQFEVSSPIKSLMQLSRLPKQDLILDFAPWARINSIITYSISAECKVGFRRQGQCRHYIYDCAVEHHDYLHEIDNYRNLLRATSIKVHGDNPYIVFSENGELKTAVTTIIFHPFPGGNGKELKEWSLENWAQLGTYLSSNGYEIAISGGREDIEAAEKLALKIQDEGGKAINLAGKYSLKEMCSILSQASLLVSVNTGIMHLGAALGLPIVALHGPTSPLRWGPLTDKAEVLVPQCECAPCISLGFEYGCSSGGCMATIAVDMVKTAVSRLLAVTNTG